MNTKTPTLSDAIRDIAMLVDVTCTQLGISRTDKAASRAADAAHNAVQGSGKVVVSRLPGCAHLHDAIVSVQGKIRKNVTQHTMPWGSRRLLTTNLFEPWIREHATLQQEHDGLIEKLVAEAPALVHQANINKGSYDVEPPTIDELSNAYSVSYSLEPVPDAGNFPSNISEGVDAWLKHKFESDMQANVQMAKRDAVSRLVKPISNLVQRCAEMEEKNEKANAGEKVKASAARDTLVSNVKAMADLVKSFNVPYDPVLGEMIDKLQIFDNVTTDQLKKDRDVRSATSARAKEILDRANNWLGVIPA